MILDKENIFSDDQAITVTANSTNIIDLGNDDALVVTSNEKFTNLFCQVCTTFAGGTSVAVTVTASNSSTFSSETTIASSGAIGTSSLVAGYKFPIQLPKMIAEQYLRATYTVVGTCSAGNITSGLILDEQTNV